MFCQPKPEIGSKKKNPFKTIIYISISLLSSPSHKESLKKKSTQSFIAIIHGLRQGSNTTNTMMQFYIYWTTVQSTNLHTKYTEHL